VPVLRLHSDIGPSFLTCPRISAVRLLVCLCVVSGGAFPQALPQIDPAGVVNAASFATPISPGSLVSIFGSNLAATTMTAQGTPLPTQLGGTSVTVDGIKAPLLFVSPGRVNIQLPSSIQVSADTTTQSTVIVATSIGSSPPVTVPVFVASPALFTADGTGCGRVAALNMASDGSVSVNAPSNSAAPGDIVTLFGTGVPTYSLPDGTGTGPPRLFLEDFELSIDAAPVSSVTYVGPAPVGMFQVNIQIPKDVREGCAIPISAGSYGLTGPTLTVSIHSGRGQCFDPAIRSYGQITLTKTTSSGTANDGPSETLTATFPVSPGLTLPRQEQMAFSPAYTIHNNSSTPVSRTCPVIGYSQQSVGPISVQSTSTAQTITVQPSSDEDGVVYQQALPNGFISPGQYVISTSGTPVAFQGKVSVGSPIQIQTALGPGTQIRSDRPFTVNWTGGDPGTLVRVALYTGGIRTEYDDTYADVASGSATFAPICRGAYEGSPQFCWFSIPFSNTAEVVVEVLPAPTNVTSLAAQGITDGVELSWKYGYVFGGLTLQ